MKRFLVFAYENYYPSGGWHDFQGTFETLDEAKAKAISLERTGFNSYVDTYPNVDIVDTATMEIVAVAG